MKQDILLITPPFTQLNTPYPATAYLKGFLNTKGVKSFQVDLGIEVILALFSKEGLTRLFKEFDNQKIEFLANSKRIWRLRNNYINTIDQIISFLQDNNPTLSHLICKGNFLPEASRFSQLEDLDWAFGTMGTRDKAKHLATLYLEDLSDFITETIDPHFGFSRYAERLGRAASTFDMLETEINQPESFIDKITIDILQEKILKINPKLVALSIPFPGNLYSGLKCGQWIKNNFPEIQIAFGGGYANTELRSLKEPRVFKYVDFICLDDGEAPLLNLLEYVHGDREISKLKRTFALHNGTVTYYNESEERDFSMQEIGTPDYSDLLLDKYISVIEIANPMHSLWSNGRWNKLTLAHGCYWGRCTFCDVSLDYIKHFEPQTAKVICDKIEEIMAQTSQSGFHFVDEAAPPALLKELALEIIRRKLTISWWGNIRFEKNFTQDLCLLLKESGCIAVSGGLEVASDRLLSIINKGVTVAQVARVCQHFTQAGIMVHAYLMYGFPTQTTQETIDSLEVVRQIFMHGIIQSGFWHLFTMTAHSTIGLNPEKFNVKKKSEIIGSFANNDILHIDKTGADHEQFSEGLRKALYNFMHGVGFDLPLQKWFDEFKIPQTQIKANNIAEILETNVHQDFSPHSKFYWLGNTPEIKYFTKSKKGQTYQMTELQFTNNKTLFNIKVNQELGEWICQILPALSIYNNSTLSYSDLTEDFSNKSLGDFDAFFISRTMSQLRKNGLLVL